MSRRQTLAAASSTRRADDARGRRRRRGRPLTAGAISSSRSCPAQRGSFGPPKTGSLDPSVGAAFHACRRPGLCKPCWAPASPGVVLSDEPVSQLCQRPKLPIRSGAPGRPLALPVNPGDRDLVRDRWCHVVEIALRGAEPAPAADPLPRRGEMTRSRLVGADLLRGDQQREAHREVLSRASQEIIVHVRQDAEARA